MMTKSEWRMTMPQLTKCRIDDYVYDIAFNELPTWKTMSDGRNVYFYAIAASNIVFVCGWSPKEQTIIFVASSFWSTLEDTVVFKDPVFKDKILSSYNMNEQFLLHKLYNISEHIIYAKIMESSNPFTIVK